MSNRPLTDRQKRWLGDLAAGRNPMDRFHGRAARGGGTGTRASLFQRGLTTLLGDITDKGREALRLLAPNGGREKAGMR